jgi:hypothetical protein
MKILIKDINLFENFMRSIIKLLPACKFQISKDKCEIYGFNENLVLRAEYETNVLVSPEGDATFCLSKLSNFYKSIQLISEFNKGDNKEVELDYDGTFIKHKSSTKFKFSTVKEETIEKSITKKLTATLVNEYGCTINNVLIKKLTSLSCISNNERIKVYLYKEGNSIFGEIDDKQLRISDSVSIPISNNFYGDWGSLIILNLEAFRNFNLLDAPEIILNMTDKKALLITNEIVEGDKFVKIKVIASPLKE